MPMTVPGTTAYEAGLTAENGFASQADVLVNTRTAADFVGATKMDRPEWGAVDPTNGMVYFTLTNNTGREVTDGPNPRPANAYGHIIRWREAGDDHAATTFEWDIFVLAGPAEDSRNLAGEPGVVAHLIAGTVAFGAGLTWGSVAIRW